MGSYELSVKQGMDIPFNLVFTDSNGDAIDITDYTIYFMVKTDINDSDANALISKTVTSHSNPTSGLSTFTITRENTESLDFGTYVYDLQIIKDDDSRKGTVVDNFIITPSVKTGN